MIQLSELFSRISTFPSVALLRQIIFKNGYSCVNDIFSIYFVDRKFLKKPGFRSPRCMEFLPVSLNYHVTSAYVLFIYANIYVLTIPASPLYDLNVCKKMFSNCIPDLNSNTRSNKLIIYNLYYLCLVFSFNNSLKEMLWKSMVVN